MEVGITTRSDVEGQAAGGLPLRLSLASAGCKGRGPCSQPPEVLSTTEPPVPTQAMEWTGSEPGLPGEPLVVLGAAGHPVLTWNESLLDANHHTSREAQQAQRVAGGSLPSGSCLSRGALG
jgi:hypothetical protein